MIGVAERYKNLQFNRSGSKRNELRVLHQIEFITDVGYKLKIANGRHYLNCLRSQIIGWIDRKKIIAGQTIKIAMEIIPSLLFDLIVPAIIKTMVNRYT